MSRGYSLPLSPQLEVVDGPLIDFTVQNPSYAWAAGGLISNLRDLERFFRGLLGGELLPSELLSEMLTTVPVRRASLPLPLFDRNGLGIIEADTPAGSLVGAAGGIPGFLTIVFSTPDGRRQLGVMINVGDRAPGPVVATFLRAFRVLGLRLRS
jgi:D-alanyl-D-alanine carboxypeptidase